MSEAVTVGYDDGVATVTIDQPGTRNALTEDVARGLIDAVDDVEGSDARCLVVEGAGDTFSAGGDVNMMIEGLAGDVTTAEKVRIVIELTGRAVARVAECPLPTVAKIDGAAFGAGANLAIACDLQVASESSSVSFGFRNVGLAVDSGTSYLLPRLVGENVAKELVFTGERLPAAEAADLGVLNRVYPDDEFDERTAELVDRIASGPTVALRASKRLLNRGSGRSLREAVECEADAQAAVFESADHREGAEAFMEGRDPSFEGR
ncbi:enoyl-CoA hydratase/isomerase family protein [Halostella litorea]|uniref:enoyl-CoA hydratase/isomerase family protein n=1 Tax=Halostella litorea TaxID=2528831 RepID=UPI001092BEDE|nr:enoyl-CoA hydratase-related protein [Halostella litorea]